MTEITNQDLTDATLTGDGVFDLLMRSAKAHLDSEFQKGRIKGSDYSTVYLGSLNAVMQYGIQFLLEKEKAHQQAELLAAQVQTETKQQALLDQQTKNALAEHEILVKRALKLDADTALTEQQALNAQAEKLSIEARTAHTEQQTTNLAADKLNTEAQTEHTIAQTANLAAEKAVTEQRATNMATENQTMLLQQDKLTQETEMLGKEALHLYGDGTTPGLTELQRNQVTAETDLTNQRAATLSAEQDNIARQGALLDAQAAQTQADASLTAQREANLAAEKLNITKQGALLDAQTDQTVAEAALTDQRKLNLVSEELRIDAETAQVKQRTTNLTAEKLQTEAQTALTDQQAKNALTENDTMLKQQDKLVADTALVTQQEANAVLEGKVLTGQKCKLDAEFDLLTEQRQKTVAETAVLAQKKVTEQAQTVGSGVDPDSVIGRQKALYQSQAEGYIRDAEQKVAKIMADTWNVRRTTDTGTQANTTNKLDDASVGRAVSALLSGVNA